ncbi:hypothetical protein GCM10010372_19730 [Streptomyces tauricus]|nr:hypothetical protein GCM10010372_19730 [Streptomyces tauricus]
MPFAMVWAAAWAGPAVTRAPARARQRARSTAYRRLISGTLLRVAPGFGVGGHKSEQKCSAFRTTSVIPNAEKVRACYEEVNGSDGSDPEERVPGPAADPVTAGQGEWAVQGPLSVAGDRKRG